MPCTTVRDASYTPIEGIPYCVTRHLLLYNLAFLMTGAFYSADFPSGFSLDSGCRGKFVHHSGVVGTDELAVDATACGALDDVAIDLAVAVYRPVFF